MLNVGVAGFVALALAGMTCFAQNADAPKEPAKFYKLEFVVKELDAGKVINARSYSMMVSTSSQRTATHTDSRLSVPTGGGNSQMVNVGVNIDCSSLKEMTNELSVTLKAEISSMVQEPTTTSTYPIIRENVWESTVIVPIKRPTMIFSSDDTATKRQMQMDLTATPIQ